MSFQYWGLQIHSDSLCPCFLTIRYWPKLLFWLGNFLSKFLMTSWQSKTLDKWTFIQCICNLAHLGHGSHRSNLTKRRIYSAFRSSFSCWKWPNINESSFKLHLQSTTDNINFYSNTSFPIYWYVWHRPDFNILSISKYQIQYSWMDVRFTQSQ